MSAPQSAKAVSSTQAVLDAVCELWRMEQPATRETVAEITGLKLSTVDDRLGFLVDEEKLKRVLRGHYIPVINHPKARNISKEILEDGTVLYEFSSDTGSTVLKLTPKEDRTLAALTAGAATQLIAIEATRQQSILLTSMAAELDRIKRENKALQAAKKQAGSQFSLLD